MLNVFFVKLKYVSLRLLSDRRLRILIYVFFWFAVHETVHGFLLLLLHNSYSIHDDDPRRHLCPMRKEMRACYHRGQNSRGNHCYNNALYFFRCVFHDDYFLRLFFVSPDGAAPPDLLLLGFRVTRCRPFPAIAVLHIH